MQGSYKVKCGDGWVPGGKRHSHDLCPIRRIVAACASSVIAIWDLSKVHFCSPQPPPSSPQKPRS